jgi:hypothetical protein
MNSYRSFLIFCACLVIHSGLLSQSHDKDGYYLDLKGDTVHGKFIGYRETVVSPSSVAFQAGGSSAVIQLSPDQCRMLFIANSGVYLAYRGKRLTNPADYHDAGLDTGDVYEDISSFLHELYNNGTYRLYQFNNGKRSNFYVGSGDAAPVELLYKETLGNGGVVESQTFRIQLTSLFQTILEKYPQRQRQINAVAYDASHLTSLFNSMAAGNKSVKSTARYPVELYIGAGASSNALRVKVGSVFGGPSAFPDEEADYPSQTSFLFEVGVKVPLRLEARRLFLAFRADYYRFTHSHFFDDDIVDHTTTRFASQVISIPLGMGYKIIDDKGFSVELSAGPALSFLLQGAETKSLNSGPPMTSPDAKRGLVVSFFGEAAIGLFSKVDLFAGYYTPVSISESEEVNATHRSIRYGARVRIF